tara:strand:- start:101 stop:481 length:381 start_codon:yes stop_codon:yes gene_type:complete
MTHRVGHDIWIGNVKQPPLPKVYRSTVPPSRRFESNKGILESLKGTTSSGLLSAGEVPPFYQGPKDVYPYNSAESRREDEEDMVLKEMESVTNQIPGLYESDPRLHWMGYPRAFWSRYHSIINRPH